jgi:hypothetical protein
VNTAALSDAAPSGRGRELRRSAPMQAAAKFGLTARGLVYVLLGVLVIAVAFGNGGAGTEKDQRGAMQELAQHSGGLVVLWVIAVGLVGYALWRLAEVAFGPAAKDDGVGPRLMSLARAVSYGALAYSAFSIIAGRRQSQAKRNTELSARIMSHSGGRWLVGAIGLGIAAVGITLAVRGLKRKFEKKLRMGEMSPRTRTAVRTLGVIGTVARGLVFALAGVLVVDAAVRYDPNKASGVDAAIRTLAQQPAGEALLVVTGLGLLAFAAYALTEARWRIT